MPVVCVVCVPIDTLCKLQRIFESQHMHDADRGLWFFANYLVNRWIGVEHSLPAFHPLIWNVDTVDGNIRWLALIGCCVVGLALAARGIVGKTKEI